MRIPTPTQAAVAAALLLTASAAFAQSPIRQTRIGRAAPGHLRSDAIPRTDPATERAMTAIFHGPEVKKLNVRGHEFNMKPAGRTVRGGVTTLTGYFSHHLGFGRRDDQVHYTIQVRGRTIRSIETMVYRGGIWKTIPVGAMNRAIGNVVGVKPLPTRAPALLAGGLGRLLDGSWEGAAQYLIATAAVRLADEGVERPNAGLMDAMAEALAKEAQNGTFPPTGTAGPDVVAPDPSPAPRPDAYVLGVGLSPVTFRRPIEEAGGRRSGYRLQVVPRAFRAGLRVNAVTPNSAAARAGLEPGDVLVEANGAALESLAALDAALANSRGVLRAKVVNVRTGAIVPVTVQLDPSFNRSTARR